MGIPAALAIGILGTPLCASAQEPSKASPGRQPTLEERVADLEAVTNSTAPDAVGRASKVSTSAGDNAWLLVSTALVLLMTAPGLALFYGGLVRKKNVLSTMMHSMFLMALMSILWVVFGYSIAFSGDGCAYFGSFSQYFMLRGVGSAPNADYAGTVPHQTYMLFQLMFAIITPALISGAYAERMKFSAMILFTTLWAIIVYFPLAHMVWGKGGLLNWALGGSIPALDFAGGTVVHISSGVAALVCALVLGKRLGYPQEPILPHNVVMSMTGAGLLWVGWFGFNAGSAVVAGGLASSAFAATHFAAAAATLSWMGLEWLLRGKPSALGAASGMVAGLVAITPASGFVTIPSALLIGLLAGGICYLSASRLKAALGYDDSLDAFGVHGVGGTLGALLTGLFASAEVNPAIKDTWKHNGIAVSLTGGFSQLLHQMVAVGVAWTLSAVATFVILKIVDVSVGLRASESQETDGMDVSLHGESAYN